MTVMRAALFLDFDNVYSGLMKLDPQAADLFARQPGVWLERLATRYLTDDERRWLVLRCYMNPAGWLPDPEDSTQRTYFSRLRPFFTRAGFEVIDCPSLTYSSKNSADIRIVLDAMDLLAAGPHIEEYVIASGDSDLAPLLLRLRAADRRTSILSPSDAVTGFVSIADRAIDAQQVLGLLDDETIDDLPNEPRDPVDPAMGVTGTDLGDARERFRAIVTTAYAEADEPLNLARLSSQVVGEIGPDVLASRWFGTGGFAAAVDSLQLPNLRRSGHFLWDESRHQPPQEGPVALDSAPQPPAMDRLCSLLGVPRLPRMAWPQAADALARYAATHAFNLTEASRWSRDTLADEGVQVGRTALGFIVRASLFGGASLAAQPPPTGPQILAANLRNILDRAQRADIELTEAEVAEVTDWLGASPAEVPHDE